MSDSPYYRLKDNSNNDDDDTLSNAIPLVATSKNDVCISLEDSDNPNEEEIKNQFVKNIYKQACEISGRSPNEGLKRMHFFYDMFAVQDSYNPNLELWWMQYGHPIDQWIEVISRNFYTVQVSQGRYGRLVLYQDDYVQEAVDDIITKCEYLDLKIVYD